MGVAAAGVWVSVRCVNEWVGWERFGWMARERERDFKIRVMGC